MRNLSSSSGPGSPSSLASPTMMKQRQKGAPTPCCTKVGLKRGPWTPEEDEVLAKFVRKEGEGRWRTLPKRAGLLRCGKSCRLRWMNYLRPSIKRGPIAPDEEDLILRLHRLLGNRWSLIAGRIPGRTDNEIKNYWNTHLSKKLISQGIDPRTHKPLISSSSTTGPDPLLPKGPKIQPPATMPHRNPNPGANPIPIPSVLQQTSGDPGGPGIHDDQDGYFGELSMEQYGGWQNSEGIAALNLPGSQGGGDSGGDGGIDCCTDDVFSFLDSLINDDIVLQTQHQNVDYNDNNNGSKDGQIQSTDPIKSSEPGFVLGTSSLWESTFTSSVSLDDEEIHGQFVDHAGK